MRLATWNVNSIRVRINAVIAWLDRHDADIACLQETRCRDEQFPAEAFAAAGYEVAHHGLDHRNGVAIASRVGLADVVAGFRGPQVPPFDEPRLVAATCAGIRLHSLYVPNGRALADPHYLFKLVWLERLRAEVLLDGVDRPRVLAGDFNVAPADDDIYDPVRWRRRTHASPAERAALAALTELGLVDLVRQHQVPPGPFTWWNNRPGALDKDQGLRIDHVFASPAVAARVDAAWVDRAERASARPSDHAPVVVDLGTG